MVNQYIEFNLKIISGNWKFIQIQVDKSPPFTRSLDENFPFPTVKVMNEIPEKKRKMVKSIWYNKMRVNNHKLKISLATRDHEQAIVNVNILLLVSLLNMIVVYLGVVRE